MVLDTLTITFPLSEESRAKCAKAFKKVHYYPDREQAPPPELVRETEIWFTNWLGLPADVKKEDLGKSRIVQLTSAGANMALKHPAFEDPEILKRVKICNTSGVHVLSIPAYIVGQVVNLYMNIHTSVYITRAQRRWPRRGEIKYRPTPAERDAPPNPNAFGTAGFRRLRGRTAGMLGYGAIARETARLLQTFGIEIIAANSTGERKVDDGYIVPGTGDKEGTIPRAYYSTNDPASFAEFLSKSDILIASLPSTPQTHYMLTKELFAKLPPDAVFINVGRGDLAKSEDILAALDAEDGLLGVGLDVTDPEPLPDNHPLLSHPRAVITPHNSSDFEGYFDAGTDMMLASVERVRAGGEPMNVIDPKKGY